MKLSNWTLPGPVGIRLRGLLHGLERFTIVLALASTDSIVAAADFLGIPVDTLEWKMKKNRISARQCREAVGRPLAKVSPAARAAATAGE